MDMEDVETGLTDDETIRLHCQYGLVEISNPASSPTSKYDLLLVDALVGQLCRIYGRRANQALLDRLDVGVYGPNQESKEQYRIVLNGLYHATQQQQEALEIFGEVDWSEGE
jgi:hypothetical protein